MSTKINNDLIWANLIHLGNNMWCDREIEKWEDPWARVDITPYRIARPYLRFEQDFWDKLLIKMADSGINTVVLDIGEGLKFESHPEISATDAWSADKLKHEIQKMKKLGIEALPKLNFSTGHDAWLGQYSRCVSTDTYYKVCKELIEEVTDIFDTPRYFHLGYDEETAKHQHQYDFVTIRQHELWWHDFYYFVDILEKLNVRPWIWSDYAWNHEKEFFNKMPKSVVQSNWYYFTKEVDCNWDKDENERMFGLFKKLADKGYDQIPAMSNWLTPENFEYVVNHCTTEMDTTNLKGFLQTTWLPTIKEFEDLHMEALNEIKKHKMVN